MKLKFFIIFAIGCTFVFVNSQGISQRSCHTPSGKAGYCINLQECRVEADLYEQYKYNLNYILHIRRSNENCNFEPEVICCPLGNSIILKNVDQSNLLNPPQCGVSKVSHDRVVGGVPASIGGWPWIALLGYQSSLGENLIKWKCSGSVITSRHILTAAHCIRNDLVVVRLGEHDLSKDTETRTIDIQIKEKISHPSYDKFDGHSDVAVLVLESEIPFSTKISPVCLPLDDAERSKNLINKTPYIAGWGKTEEGGNLADVLQETQVPVITNEQCKNNYAAVSNFLSQKQFDDAVICAGYKEGGRDACKGDSGGPLMMPFEKNRKYYYYQVGVVSYGFGCARAEVPGVYARVSTFSNWIKSIVEST